MRRKLRVLFTAFEAIPFMKTGGLGDVAGSLPKALKEVDCEIRVMIPKFYTIPEEYKEKMTHVADFYVNLGWRNLYCGIEQLKHNGVIYYFVDNEYYFYRENAYGYFDDGERIAFFSKAIVESLMHLPDFKCDVLHCNDWHTALAPVFLREFYRGIELYDNVKTVFTVHNLKFQGQMSDFVLGDILGLGNIKAAADQLRSDKDSINFMKGALCYSDILTTVSPSYAQEIKTQFYGEKLDYIFCRRNDVLKGILNGIDVELFNPKTDKALVCNYDKEDLSGKEKCKKALLKEFGFDNNTDIPVIIMVGRLTEQKGMELVIRVMDQSLRLPLRFIVLGTGDKKYEDSLYYFQDKYNDKMRVCTRFDEELSHRMYGGADMLLMPSLFEPCGLSQMIAMRYGTLPIVRETGGLKDSVIPYNMYDNTGTGFSFSNYNAHEMLGTIQRAVKLYYDDKEAWSTLIDSGMSTDFSWNVAAEEYLKIYASLHPEVTPYRRKGKTR